MAFGFDTIIPAPKTKARSIDDRGKLSSDSIALLVSIEKRIFQAAAASVREIPQSV
jgi:hypothetical protein